MGNRDERVYAQIEGTADLYEPSVYSLLPVFQDFQRVVDARSEDYLPLTTVSNPYSGRHKVFIIGLLPPSVTVTGRLLDRSASVASLTGAATEAATTKAAAAKAAAAAAAPAKKPNMYQAGAHKAARAVMLAGFRKAMGRDPTPAELQYCQAIAFLESSYGKGWKGDMVESNNWGAVQCPAAQQTASDCIMYEDSQPNGQKYKVAFRKYATPEDGAADVVKNVMGRGYDKQALADPNGSVYNVSYAMRRGRYYGGFCPKAVKQYGSKDTGNISLTDPDKNAGTAACAEECVDLHAGIVWNTVNSIAAANGESLALRQGSYSEADAWYRNIAGIGGSASTNTVNTDAATTQWQDEAANAQDAAKENEKTANMDQNKTPLGEAFQAAQKRMINATLEALERIRNTPPLKLLVNPISFKVSSSKLIADGDRSRSQHIVEHWGEEQDKIDASGKLAAFFSSDQAGGDFYTGNQTLGAGPGINRTARQYSASYQNFLGLLQIYKNNGGLWLQDFYEETVAPGKGSMNLSTLGSVYIYYDNILYIGSFDTLSVTEADTGPYTLEYSFSFSVRATFLLDQVDDPNSPYNYGAGGLFTPRSTGPTRASATTSGASDEPNPDLDRLNEINRKSAAAEAEKDRKEAELRAADPLAAEQATEAARNRKPLEPSSGNSKVQNPSPSSVPKWLDDAMSGKQGAKKK